MTVFIDTTVVMYAAGADHPHRQACQDVLSQIAEGTLDATSSTAVVQEILHRFANGRRDVGVVMARGVRDLFGELLPIGNAAIARAVDLYAANPAVSARDVLHVATCLTHGIAEIVSVDEGFDSVAEIRRIPPVQLGRKT